LWAYPAEHWALSTLYDTPGTRGFNKIPDRARYKNSLFEFLHRSKDTSSRVILFPGTWNPPTIAHVDIARAALQHADEVIWVLPRSFPHKGFEAVDFAARCSMLRILTRESDGFSGAVSSGGLYAEIAHEAREYLGPDVDISIALGRDAAERIATWDYGRPGFFDEFVQEYKLLVAARRGEFSPSHHHSGRISALPMSASWDDVSSTEVRRRIAAGEEWRHLVPSALIFMIETLYGR
jgi:nicotinate-nucleotide adenylyltransferase